MLTNGLKCDKKVTFVPSSISYQATSFISQCAATQILKYAYYICTLLNDYVIYVDMCIYTINNIFLSSIVMHGFNKVYCGVWYATLLFVVIDEAFKFS